MGNESNSGIIVTVIDDYKVVINRGSQNNIKKNQRFLIYGLSDNDLIDPETGNSLGRLEIVRGTGLATHVQERLTTISSDMKRISSRKTVRKQGLLTLYPEEIIESDTEIQPFEDVKIGDLAKPI